MSKPERVLCGGDARAPPPNFLSFGSGATGAFRNRCVPTLGHARDTPAAVTGPTAIQGGSGARRPGDGRHDSRIADTGTKFPASARRIPATHCHQSRCSMAAASSGRANWRKCHEVDLRRLRQRGPRRGRIRGEGASRRYWSTSTSPAPRGTLRTPRRARAL